MFAKKVRFSIAGLMLVVSLVAAECAMLRVVWETTIEETIFALPMLNFMLFGLWRLGRSPSARPFWIGFEIIGMIWFGLMTFLRLFALPTLNIPLQWVQDHKWIASNEQNPVIIIAWLVAIYLLPPLLLATLAGWLSARYQIVRRPRSTVDDPSRSEPGVEGEKPEIQRGAPAFGHGPFPATH